MNERERLLATMRYQPRDRAPICDFGFWPETIELWHAQGLPDWVTGGHDTTATDQFFGMDRYKGRERLPVRTGLYPGFKPRVIDDRGDHELFQQSDGVIVLRRKFMGSIPQHHGHILTDRESWKTHYRPRLDPSTSGRLPANWEEATAIWQDHQRDYPMAVSAGSLFGWLRDWMGLENISLVVYDDPAWFEEMVTTIADCVCGVLSTAFEHGARFDLAMMWEDMCYNGGPLLSPAHFKEYLVPHYQRITDLLRAHGTDIILVDCDGRIDELVPLWLEGGVNCMFPIEIGTWGADPIKFRAQYGKDLLMMGGFDKHVLAKDRRAIEREVHRLTPLVEQGGYIGFCDHRVPPDVPLENYMFYLRAVRAAWGRGLNLKPLGNLLTPAGAIS